MPVKYPIVLSNFCYRLLIIMRYIYIYVYQVFLNTLHNSIGVLVLGSCSFHLNWKALVVVMPPPGYYSIGA